MSQNIYPVISLIGRFWEIDEWLSNAAVNKKFREACRSNQLVTEMVNRKEFILSRIGRCRISRNNNRSTIEVIECCYTDNNNPTVDMQQTLNEFKRVRDNDCTDTLIHELIVLRNGNRAHFGTRYFTTLTKAQKRQLALNILQRKIAQNHNSFLITVGHHFYSLSNPIQFQINYPITTRQDWIHLLRTMSANFNNHENTSQKRYNLLIQLKWQDHCIYQSQKIIYFLACAIWMLLIGIFLPLYWNNDLQDQTWRYMWMSLLGLQVGYHSIDVLIFCRNWYCHPELRFRETFLFSCASVEYERNPHLLLFNRTNYYYQEYYVFWFLLVYVRPFMFVVGCLTSQLFLCIFQVNDGDDVYGILLPFLGVMSLDWLLQFCVFADFTEQDFSILYQLIYFQNHRRTTHQNILRTLKQQYRVKIIVYTNILVQLWIAAFTIIKHIDHPMPSIVHWVYYIIGAWATLYWMLIDRLIQKIVKKDIFGSVMYILFLVGCLEVMLLFCLPQLFPIFLPSTTLFVATGMYFIKDTV